MIAIYDNDSGEGIGSVTEEQLKFLVDHLEEESKEDQDYYLDAATIDGLRAAGADEDLVGLLERAMGDREGVEIRWARE